MLSLRPHLLFPPPSFVKEAMLSGQLARRSSSFLPHRTIARAFSISRMTAAKQAYPPARRDEDFVRVYKSKKDGETKIKDPYHWLEDPDSEETKAWVDAQVDFTRAELDGAPGREAFRRTLRANWDYQKISAPSLKGDDNGVGGFYYFHFNSGLQNQYELRRIAFENFDSAYRTNDGPPGELFFDPNQLSADGTESLAATAFSEDGKHFAYGVSKSGSDFFTVYVRSTEGVFESVNDKLKLPDVIRFCKFTSIEWTKDGKGFFYQRYPEVEGDLGVSTASDKDGQIFYHRLNTDQADDELVYSNPEHPDWISGIGVTVDGKWALLTSSKDTAPSALLKVARIEEGKPYSQLAWKDVISEWGALYSYMANDGSRFWFQTNQNAPNDRVVVIDVDADELEFKEVIPEDPAAVLESAKVVHNDFLLLTYSRDVKSELYLHRLADGSRIRRFLPDFVGSINGVSGRRQHSRFFVSLGSYVDAGSVYSFDLGVAEKDVEAGDMEVVRETKVGLRPADFVSEQVFYTSKDGTRIPMTITRSKDTPLDGSAPALLYGYGGFSISLSPRFSVTWMTWVQQYSGVLAVPALRGGGEYGEKWHEAGILDKKHKTFEDFIAAAEYLVDNKYTSAGKVITNGGSNGGLTVAASANRAPKGLIGASVADVGVLDLLRFHSATIGHFWKSDYGDPDDPAHFDFIRPISPLHNVDPAGVRNMLITTADHDDRVSPFHSFKMAAEMQHQGVENCFIRIEKKAGHGAGKPTSKIIDEAVDKWTWASAQVGAKLKE